MTYWVYRVVEHPDSLGCQVNDFKNRVSDINRRIQISTDMKEGNHLLVPEEMPRFIRLDRNISPVPDLFASNNGVHIVSDRLRQVLEEHDPQLHQFIPIEVYLKSDEPAGGAWFIMNVTYKQDSVIDEMSHTDNSSRRDRMRIPRDWYDDQVTIDVRKLSNVNLWREQRYPESLVLSNRLRDALQARDIKFFELKTVNEVSAQNGIPITDYI